MRTLLGRAPGVRRVRPGACGPTPPQGDRRERHHLRRHGVHGGLLHALPGDRVGGPLDPLALRELCSGCIGHRGIAEAAGAKGEGRLHRRRRCHARYRGALHQRRLRARPRHHLHLLRQRGLHEHGHPAVGCDAVWCEHHDEPCGEVFAGEPPSEEGHASYPRRSRRALRRDRLDRLPERLRPEGRAGDQHPRPLLHPGACSLLHGMGL